MSSRHNSSEEARAMRHARAALGSLSSLLRYPALTRVQYTVLPTIVQSEDNVLVAAPTGSGKTAILDVAIGHLFRHRLDTSRTALTCGTHTLSAATTQSAITARETTEPQSDYLPMLCTDHSPREKNISDAAAAVPSARCSEPSAAEIASSPDQTRCEDNSNSTNNNAAEQHGVKAVYVCPMKALALEKYRHWTMLFPRLRVVLEMGADELLPPPLQKQQHKQATMCGVNNLASADVILTTPERLDSITRRWKEGAVRAIVQAVRLLLIDEVHTVHETRGAALEAVVSRMKIIASTRHSAAPDAHGQPSATVANRHGDRRTTYRNRADYADSGSDTSTTCHDLCVRPALCSAMRIIAMSGTLTNLDDFAEWLQVPRESIFYFDEQARPVPLTIHVLSFANDSHNPYAFDRFLSLRLCGLVRQYSCGRPCLVFCVSRRECVSAASQLVHDIQQLAQRAQRIHELQPSAALQTRLATLSDRLLQSCLQVGVGFHHAALSAEDRELVEQLFREEWVSVLCTTTTLALGVNLPARLVIVKGTTFFRSHGQREELPVSELMQMCGRAGRLGCDDAGVALILTSAHTVSLYQHLDTHAAACRGRNHSKSDSHTGTQLTSALPTATPESATQRNISDESTGTAVTSHATIAESSLHLHMIEHVNAEVALRTIYNYHSALEWAQTTFFWVRLRRNPPHYGIRFANATDQAAFQPAQFVARLIARVLCALSDVGCLHVHQRDLSLAMTNKAATTAAAAASRSAKNVVTVVGDAAQPMCEGSMEEALSAACDADSEETTNHCDKHINSGDHGYKARSNSSVALMNVLPGTQENCAWVESTARGRSMSRLYILYETVKYVHDSVCARRAEYAQKRRATELDTSHAANSGRTETGGARRDMENPGETRKTVAPLFSSSSCSECTTSPLSSRFACTSGAHSDLHTKREGEYDTGPEAFVQEQPPHPPRGLVNGPFTDTMECRLLRHTDSDELSTRQKGATKEDSANSCVNAPLELCFDLSDALALLCHSAELKEVRLRCGDRAGLNALNRRLVRFPICTGYRGGREVREDWHKAYVLLQAHLVEGEAIHDMHDRSKHTTLVEPLSSSCSPSMPATTTPHTTPTSSSLLSGLDLSLRNDCRHLCTLIPRLARFLCAYANSDNTVKSWTTSALGVASTASPACHTARQDALFTSSVQQTPMTSSHSLSYSLCLQSHLLVRMWEHKIWPHGLVLRQLSGVTLAQAQALWRAEVRTFADVCVTSPCRLELLTHRVPPFGAELQRRVARLACCTVSVSCYWVCVCAAPLRHKRCGEVCITRHVRCVEPVTRTAAGCSHTTPPRREGINGGSTLLHPFTHMATLAAITQMEVNENEHISSDENSSEKSSNEECDSRLLWQQHTQTQLCRKRAAELPCTPRCVRATQSLLSTSTTRTTPRHMLHANKDSYAEDKEDTPEEVMGEGDTDSLDVSRSSVATHDERCSRPAAEQMLGVNSSRDTFTLLVGRCDTDEVLLRRVFALPPRRCNKATRTTTAQIRARTTTQVGVQQDEKTGLALPPPRSRGEVRFVFDWPAKEPQNQSHRHPTRHRTSFVCNEEIDRSAMVRIHVLSHHLLGMDTVVDAMPPSVGKAGREHTLSCEGEQLKGTRHARALPEGGGDTPGRSAPIRDSANQTRTKHVRTKAAAVKDEAGGANVVEVAKAHAEVKAEHASLGHATIGSDTRPWHDTKGIAGSFEAMMRDLQHRPSGSRRKTARREVDGNCGNNKKERDRKEAVRIVAHTRQTTHSFHEDEDTTPASTTDHTDDLGCDEHDSSPAAPLPNTVPTPLGVHGTQPVRPSSPVAECALLSHSHSAQCATEDKRVAVDDAEDEWIGINEPVGTRADSTQHCSEAKDAGSAKHTAFDMFTRTRAEERGDDTDEAEAAIVATSPCTMFVHPGAASVTWSCIDSPVRHAECHPTLSGHTEKNAMLQSSRAVQPRVRDMYMPVPPAPHTLHPSLSPSYPHVHNPYDLDVMQNSTPAQFLFDHHSSFHAEQQQPHDYASDCPPTPHPTHHPRRVAVQLPTRLSPSPRPTSHTSRNYFFPHNFGLECHRAAHGHTPVCQGAHPYTMHIHQNNNMAYTDHNDNAYDHGMYERDVRAPATHVQDRSAATMLARWIHTPEENAYYRRYTPYPDLQNMPMTSYSSLAVHGRMQKQRGLYNKVSAWEVSRGREYQGREPAHSHRGAGANLAAHGEMERVWRMRRAHDGARHVSGAGGWW